jgi:hypothetical protein
METRVFDTLSVVSATTGVLLSETIGPIYDVLGFVVGESLMTHQLPGASRASEAHLTEQFPWIADLDIPKVGSGDNREDDVARLRAWCVDLIAERGEHLTVAAAENPDWVRSNALQDLADIMGDRPAIVVQVPDKDA